MKRRLGAFFRTFHASENTGNATGDAEVLTDFGTELFRHYFGSDGAGVERNNLNVHDTIELKFSSELLGGKDLHCLTVGIPFEWRVCFFFFHLNISGVDLKECVSCTCNVNNSGIFTLFQKW